LFPHFRPRGTPLRSDGRMTTYYAPSALDSFEWPTDDSIAALGQAIAAARGLDVVLKPIPEKLRHPKISGLTTVVERTAHVFYDPELSPLNQETTILHEFAHILHGDVGADAQFTHLRSIFDNPVEKRAEKTGMQLLAAVHRRRRKVEHRPASEALDFLAGSGASRGVE
jgi:hypothetical protein